MNNEWMNDWLRSMRIHPLKLGIGHSFLEEGADVSKIGFYQLRRKGKWLLSRWPVNSAISHLSSFYCYGVAEHCWVNSACPILFCLNKAASRRVWTGCLGLGQGGSTGCLLSRTTAKPRNELLLPGAAGTQGWAPFIISLGDRLVPSDVIWASAGTSASSPLTGNDISYQQSDLGARQTRPADPLSGAPLLPTWKSSGWHFGKQRGIWKGIKLTLKDSLKVFPNTLMLTLNYRC